MNDQFGILLQAKLDVALSTATLNQQLEQIAKNLKPLNVGVTFDSNAIKNVTNQIADVQKKLSSSGALRIVDTAQLQRDKTEIFSTIDEAVKKYQQLGQVKVQENFDPITKQMKSFTLTVQEADGVINKLKYDLAALSTGGTAFVPVKMTTQDNTSAIAEKQLQLQQQINAKLETERQKDLALQAEAEAKQKAQYEKNVQDLDNFITQYNAKIKLLQNSPNKKFVDTSSLDEFTNSMNSLDPKSEKFSEDLANLKTQFSNIQLNARSARVEQEGYAKSLDDVAGKYLAVYTAGQEVVNLFKEGFQSLVDYNKQLTLISTTANLSQDQALKLGQQYLQKSTNMGVLAPDMASLAPEFFRQTTDQQQVMENMVQTMKFAKISNLDYADSAKLVTGTMNTMKLSAKEITDTWTALGDSVNSSPAEIGTAFQKIGAEAYSLGVPFSETSAMVATLASKTRESAETTGDAIKSLYARIESLRQKGFAQDEMGNTTDVSQVSQALASVGVDLVDKETGQFRNIGTVLDELGKKFANLDTVHQRYISTVLGGVQQQGRLLALLENWGDVTNNMTTAMNSANAVTQKFDLYQQGLEAHLNKLKDTAMSVFQDSFDTHNVRDAIDAITGLVQIVDDAVKTFGIVPVTVMTASIAFMGFSSKGRDVAQSLIFLIPKLGEMVTGMTATEAAAKGLSVGIDFLSGSLRGLMSATIIGAVLTLISVGIEKLTDSFMKNKDAQDQLDQTTQQTIQNWQTQSAHIQNLVQQYDSMSKLVADGKLSPDDSNFLQVQQQLSQLVPTLTDHIDAQGNARLKNVDAINQEIAALKEEAKIQAEKTLNNFKDNYKSDQDTLNNDQSTLNQDRAKLAELEKRKAQNNGIKWGMPQLDAQIANQNMIVAMDNQKIEQDRQSAQTAIEQEAQAIYGLTGDWNSASAAAQNYVNQLAKSLTSNDFDKITKQMNPAKQAQFAAIADIENKLQAPDVANKSVDEKTTLMNDLIDEGKRAGLSMDFLNGEFKQFLGLTTDGTTALYDFGYANQRLSSSYKQLLSDTQPLTDSINKLQNGQSLSQDEQDKLIQQYPDLINQQKLVNGQYTLTIDALQKEKQQKIDTFNTSMDLLKQETNAQKQSLQERLTGYGIEIDKIKTLADVQSAQAQMLLKAAQDYNKNGMYGAPNVADPKLQADIQALADIQKLNETIQGASDGLGQDLNFGSGITSGATSATQQLTQLEQAINDVTNAYQDLQNQMEQYPQHSEQYRNAMQQEIDLLKQKKDLLQQQINNPTVGFSLPSSVQSAVGSTSTSDQVGQSPFASSAKLGYTGQYADVISSAASKYGIDPNLLAAILYQESGINPYDANGNIKTSSAGAIGIAQFMPDTAKQYGVNPDDATSSINGAAHMLSDLLNQFNGNLKLAIAGYNAGAGAAQYALSSNDPRYQQTRDYVPAVLSQYQAYSGGQAPSNVSSSVDQMKAIADAVQKAKSQITQINTDIMKAQKAIVDDMLGQYEDVSAQYQDYAKIAQTKMQDMHKGSADYNSMIDSQLRSLNEQKYVAQQEISYINGTQFKDFPDYKKKVEDLTASLADYDNQIKQLNQEKLDSNLAPLIQQNTIIDDTVKKLEQQNQLYKDKNTANVYDPAYITNLNTEITLQNQKVQILQQQNQMIEQQGDLTDANLQTIEQNNQAIADAQSAIKQSQLAVANADVAAMKSGIQEEINAENERHQQVINNLNEESKAYENQINNQLKQLQDQKSANDYNDQLTTEQKARQKIVDQINALSMDTSVDAKSKRADLQQQLADEDQKIAKMQQDREYQLRQENLQDQLNAYKQDVQNKTDAENDKYNSTKNSLQNQLDDTQHWDQVTKDILSGNVSGIQDQMKTLIAGLESYSNTSTNTVDGYFNHVLQKAQEVTTAMNQLNSIANTNNPSSDPLASAKAQVAAYQQQWQTAFNNKQFDQATLAHIKAIEVASQNGGIYNSATGTYNWVNPNSLTVDQVRQIIQQLGDVWKVANAQDQATLHQIAYQLGTSHGGQYNSSTGVWTFPSSIAQAANGAELPMWGSGGKAMIVHEGEIVQTKDTAQDIKSVASSAKDFKSIASKFGNLNIADLASKINLDAMKQSMLPTVSTPNMNGLMSIVNNINNKEGDTHIHLENVTFQGVQDVEDGADRLVTRLASQYRKFGGQFRTR